MTGNIIVSICCLGDMAVNAPSSSGCALGHGGRLQPYHPRKHELTITKPTPANFYFDISTTYVGNCTLLLSLAYFGRSVFSKLVAM